MGKLNGLYKDFCAIGGQLPIETKANVIEDFIGEIENLDNEVRDREPPLLVMLEVDNLDPESDELDFDSKISLRKSEHGDAAFCGGNLDFNFNEYV